MSLSRSISVASLFLFACGDDTPSASPLPCVPGDSHACTCTDGRSGAQVCTADGQSYGVCACDGGPAGGESASGGSSPTGGASTGGASTGGASTGGAATGGSGTGGALAGGGGAGGGSAGCAVDGDCLVADSYCDAGSCAPRKVMGASCSADNACLTGSCVDGVCCGGACDGLCEACDVAGSVGLCAPIPAGDDPALECSFGLTCDGARTCQPQLEWARTFGSSGSDYAQGVALDGTGNLVLAGNLASAIDFGGGTLAPTGNLDTYVTKLDPNGGHLFSTHFGLSGETTFGALAVDANGNIILSGTLNPASSVSFGGATYTSVDGGIWVAKLSPAGTVLWSASFDGVGYDTVGGLTLGPSGEVILSGSFSSDIDFGGGPLANAGGTDYFVVALNGAGNHLWSRSFGSPAYEPSSRVACTPSGEIWLTSNLFGAISIDFGGGALTTNGGSHSVVVKLDSGGNHLWSAVLDGAITAIAADDTGGVLFADNYDIGLAHLGGAPLQGPGLALVSLDGSGVASWTKPFFVKNDGFSSQGFIGSLSVASNGDVLLGGAFNTFLGIDGVVLTGFTAAGWAARLDPIGNLIWARGIGAFDSVYVVGAAASANRSVLLGSFATAFDPGTGPVASAGSADIFLESIAP